MAHTESATKYPPGSLAYAPEGDCDGERIGIDHFVTTSDGSTEVVCAPDEEAGRLFAAAPDMHGELQNLLRVFERDATPANFETQPSGEGVRVFVTHRTAERIRQLLANVKGEPQ